MKTLRSAGAPKSGISVATAAGAASRMALLLFVVQCHPTLGDEPTPTKGEGADASRSITIQVTDPDGQPVSGALICQWVAWEADGPEYYGPGNEHVEGAGNDGVASIEADRFLWNIDGTTTFSCIDPERKMIGLVQLRRDDLPDEVSVTLQPTCVVEGKIGSAELEQLGRDIGWTNCYISWNGKRVMGSGTNRFRFLLPPGEYELYPYGSQVYPENVPITVSESDRVRRVDVDLTPVRWALLIGKPAPELREIKGWLNSEPVQLADLGGKLVLLEFWGHWCGPCIYSMPKLMDLHDEFHDQGLVVIGVHDDSVASVAALKEELAPIQEEIWDGREIPFPVALAGGGVTPIMGADDTARNTARGAICAEYGIYSWPTAILIDRDGLVQGAFQYRAEDAREKLAALLAAQGE